MPQDDKTRANQLIDRFSDAGGLNVAALCDELSKQAMQWTLTVFEIFNVLTERGFDQAAHESVCRDLISRINPANLIQLAQSIHGQILLQRIQYIMNCEANGSQSTCQYVGAAVTRAKEIERSNQPRQMSEEEMSWYVNYNETKEVMWNLSKGVWNTHGPRVTFNKEICWDLPASGVGFTTYNTDDLKGKRKDKYGYDQIGTKETIEAMIQIAKEWYRLHPDRVLQYGDISRPGGINTPDHGTHMTGKAFDMRLLRKDSQTGGFEYTAKGIYSPELTKELILLVRRLYPGTELYFNDPALTEKDSETKSFVRPSDSTHNNHLHVMFPGGKE